MLLHIQDFHKYLFLKAESFYDVNFVVTVDTRGYDNLQFHQWRQSWHITTLDFNLRRVYGHTTIPFLLPEENGNLLRQFTLHSLSIKSNWLNIPYLDNGNCLNAISYVT